MSLPYVPYKRSSQQFNANPPSTSAASPLSQRSQTPPPPPLLTQQQQSNQSPVANTGKVAVVDPATSSLDRFPRSPPPESTSGAFSSAQRSRLLDHPSRSSSAHASSSRTPYMPGFQPSGVYRPRTEQFVDLRAKHGEGRRLEYGRIARRLEKLVHLHFLDPSTTTSSVVAAPAPTAKLASLTQSVIKSRSISASDLWSTVRQSVKTDNQRRGDEIRQAEQTIVHWQDDRSVQSCPICL